MKPTPVATLVVGTNNYLDVHATRSGPVLLPYLTPPQQHRQPPPPPPMQLSPQSQLGQVPLTGGSNAYVSQVERYKQQLYSDVDYVMFPLKDPALSEQEYIDAKQCSLLAAAYPPPPPYPKTSTIYKSTPYLSNNVNCTSSVSNKYSSSNQNLSDTTGSSYYGHLLYGGNPGSQYAASSSLYSGSSGRTYASPPPLPPPANNHNSSRALIHGLSRSHENILSSDSASLGIVSQTHRRLPPPPPPYQVIYPLIIYIFFFFLSQKLKLRIIFFYLIT